MFYHIHLFVALKYINYPMMILTKSSKPVPVMVIGVLFYGRKYPWYKYVSVFLLICGISLFTAYKDSSKKKVDEGSGDMWTILFGICLVVINLSLDGYTNNEQDHIFKAHNATSLEMMKNVNLWQLLYITIYLGISWCIYGEASEVNTAYLGLTHCSDMKFDVALFCTFAAAGQVLLFALIKEFGSLLWVTVSVTRKLFSVLASVIIFQHSVNKTQWIGISLVFCGLALDTVMSYMEKKVVKHKKTDGDENEEKGNEKVDTDSKTNTSKSKTNNKSRTKKE